MCTTCSAHNPGARKKEETGKGKEVKKEGQKKKK